MLRISDVPMSGGASASLESLRSSQRGGPARQTFFTKSEEKAVIGSFDLPAEKGPTQPPGDTERRKAVAQLSVERDTLTDKCNAYGKRIEELEAAVRSLTAENEELSRKLSECELSRLAAKRMHGALAAEYDALRTSALATLRELRAAAGASAQDADMRAERLERLLLKKQ